MRLTTITLGIALIAPACAPLMAQDAQPDTQLFTAPGETPKPFDWSRFKLLVPASKAPAPRVILNTPKPLATVAENSNRPCAVMRITRPNASIDPLIAPNNQKPALPLEANSKDISERNVPAPSCLDLGRLPNRER